MTHQGSASSTAARGLAGARATSFWLEATPAPDPSPALVDDISCDLLVVGGGFAGLWTALKAVERDPRRNVVVVEASRVGGAASGRNGGFVSASLTHGTANGQSRWPDEMPLLERLGRENLEEMIADVQRLGIDCSLELTGKISIATRPHQLRELQEGAALAARYGREVTVLDAHELRERVDSPTFLGGTYDATGSALVDPAKLARGLLRACRDAGVQVYEGTPATALHQRAGGVLVSTPYASVQAEQVVLATNAFPSLLRRLRLSTVPVYDYALVTEPLSGHRLDAIGWKGREGLTDAGNHFHYFRLTDDDRMLWGGYDAVYRYGSRMGPAQDARPETFAKLADQLVDTFPALEGVNFSHAWGGAIDTCTRFCAFYGTALGGRVGYALGYTGLGVSATRFAADVVLDLLAGRPTERTGLAMVREKPLPFPPEPVRAAGIAMTQRSMGRADVTGRRDLLLRTMDRLGIGFDS
jgi:glycine/D-amino acid oxidase-like deaminating enzyme